MEIKIKPQVLKCQGSWTSKIYGVVLVEKESDIDKMYNLLCEQDDYWESYKNLIKVAPTEINSTSDIFRMCEYCGKTDIYNVEKLRTKIDFILFQYDEDCEY